MSTWQSFNLRDLLPGANLAPLIQPVLDALSLVEQANAAISAILAAQALPVDPQLAAYNAALQAVLSAVGAVLSDSANASAGLLLAVPRSAEELPQYARGLQGWRSLVAGSYYDPGDLQRPLVGPGGTAGALVVVVTSPSAAVFLDRLQGLLRFFGQGAAAENLRVPAPRSFKVVPCDDDGTPVDDPFTALIPGASASPTALRLEWEEPSLSRQLLNLYEGQLAFVEATSSSRLGSTPGNSVPVGAAAGPSQRDADRAAAGTAATPDDGAVPVAAPATAAGSPAQGGWTPLDPANPSLGGSLFGINPTGVQKDWLAGRYFLVLKGPRYVGVSNARYYRVSIVPQDVRPLLDATSGRWELRRGNGTTPYAGSLPSAPALGILPDAASLQAEDLIGAVLNVWRAAYLFRMDVAVRDPLTASLAVPGNGLLSRNPVPPALTGGADWGVPEPVLNGGVRTLVRAPLIPAGSFPSTAEALSQSADPGVAILAGFDPFAGQDELFQPLTSEAGGETFRRWADRQAIVTLRGVAARLAQQDGFRARWLADYRAAEPGIIALLTNPLGSPAPGWASTGNVTRAAVANLLSSLASFAAPGTPPDWTSYRVISDGFPLVGAYLQGLVASLNALSALGADVLTSFQANLDALQGRLAALQALTTALNQAVDFFAGLDQTVSLLYVPPAPGGSDRVASEILTAAGAPTTSPTDYAAGVVLDLSGPDLAALNTLLSLLFNL